MRKEIVVAPRVVPIVAGSIEKMVARRCVKRVIGRADPGKRGDIGELSDLRICDIGIAIAIAVIVKTRVCDATAFADLDIRSERAVRDLAFGMDERSVCRQAGMIRSRAPLL
jgi:hypothetical protein